MLLLLPSPLLLHLGLWAGQGWRGQLAEMLLMLEHKAHRGAGAEAGAGAGASESSDGEMEEGE